MSPRSHKAQTIRSRELPSLAFRVHEAAAVLGVSQDFFREMIAPELRCVRRGAVKLVSRAELEDWLSRNASKVVDDD